MRFAIDTEFIDEPDWSELISFGIAAEDGDYLYFEFDFPERALTPWLVENVAPHLTGEKTTFLDAANQIDEWIRGKHEAPEFWCYVGAYDFYWLCRLFGGLMKLPKDWDKTYNEFATYSNGFPDLFGPRHHAGNDARSTMAAIKKFLG